MVARADPTASPRLESLEMPTGLTVAGPVQVFRTINNTAAISKEFSLLNQQGSRVVQGSIQIIPVKDSLLYVQPVYVLSENEWFTGNPSETVRTGRTQINATIPAWAIAGSDTVIKGTYTGAEFVGATLQARNTATSPWYAVASHNVFGGTFEFAVASRGTRQYRVAFANVTAQDEPSVWYGGYSPAVTTTTQQKAIATLSVNRTVAGTEIGAAMWFSLNPLLVMMMTPLLLARWRRQSEQGRELSVMHKMAVGSLLVAASYLLVAFAELLTGEAPAHWMWLLSFFVIFTLGELYILPNGLGIFARLAPPKLGASTVAAWYLAIFTGSLAAGQVGRLWSRLDHVAFFVLLAGIAILSAVLLYLLDRPARRILARTAQDKGVDLTDVPEGLARPQNA
jgi:hypothetical protein